ncbi:heterokaryon incompatibility protein-domain-containing protein [Paraphoma chrysanthemicola]|nr:heterokaryon incompatibility protein-domain-containing protein [Paraphoma chrysanthemicola]
MLCNTCEAPTTLPAFGESAEILKNIPDVKDELTPLTALYASANQGCIRCHVILEAVNKWHNSRNDLHHVQHPEQYVIGIAPLPPPGAKAGRTGGLGRAVAVTRKESWEHYGYLAWSRNDYFWEFDVKFELYTENDAASARYQIPRLISVPATILCLADYARQAREWLAYCISSHGDCCSEVVQELPTRVIDVGDDVNQARLVETTPGQRDAYCALSYCWGRNRAFTTTIATFRDRVNGFRIEELPKTISDAVLLARALGMRYIWVDSICIIQDSDVDWTYEASRMCAVYTNAAITFAAIDSPASESGLFVAGSNRRRVMLERISGPIYARAHSHSALDDPRTSQYDGTPARVLHTRGWCLQEIALSTRVLWMKSSEINWSCIRSTACECDPVPTDNLHHSNLFVLEFILSGVRHHEFLRSEPSQWLDLWTGLVLEFTGRRLTQAPDRLPAIAGLATLIQRHSKTRYLFGLWETRDILEQLLWSSLTHAGESTWAQYTRDSRLRLTTNLAPSWSWASSSAHVSIPHGDFSDTVEKVTSPRWSELGGIKTRVWALRSIAVNMNTSNPFGTGTGTLELHSLLVPVMIHTHKSNGESVWSLTYAQDRPESPDKVPLVLLRQFDWLQSCNIEDADGGYHFDAWRKDSRIDYEDESNWYGERNLYFIFANVSAQQQGKAKFFNGLVLEQLNCDDPTGIVFRRLGYGEGAFMKLEDAQPGSQRAPDVVPLQNINESFTRATWEYWKQLGMWSAIRLV